MRQTWDPDCPAVLQLPSGRLIRGRSLRLETPPEPPPQFALYCLGKPPAKTPWEAHWVRWPDFRLPSDRAAARKAFVEALGRTTTERVEIACNGGIGRTGTAMACLAILDGVPPDEAMAYVRARYARRAVETPWQRRFVRRFA